MGWTYFDRDKSKTLRQTFEREFTPNEVVDFAVHGFREAYAVLRTPDGRTVGMVILMDQSGRNGMNFGHKDMTESMGPFYTNAPVRLIDLLDRDAPLNDENDPRGSARQWRQSCRDAAARRAERRAMRRNPALRAATMFRD